VEYDSSSSMDSVVSAESAVEVTLSPSSESESKENVVSMFGVCKSSPTSLSSVVSTESIVVSFSSIGDEVVFAVSTNPEADSWDVSLGRAPSIVVLSDTFGSRVELKPSSEVSVV